MAECVIDDILSVLKKHRENNASAYVSTAHADEFFSARRTEPLERIVADVSAIKPVDSFSNSGWDALRAMTENCEKCGLCQTRNKVVFGCGSESARLMFIGEGPGADEDAQGVPFVGKAGQLLDKMIAAMQFSRGEVYIANIVKCRPPENRNPMPDEAQACLPYLERQIELVAPEVIVVLGAVAMEYLLGIKGIARNRGSWLEYKGIKVMPTFHPSYLLRYEAAKKDAWSDLQKVMAVFGKTHRR